MMQCWMGKAAEDLSFLIYLLAEMATALSHYVRDHYVRTLK